MPYEIIKTGDRYCVHKQGEQQPIDGGCHDTRQEAQDHMAALYASEPDATRALGESTDLVAVLFRALIAQKAGQRHSAADQKMLNAMHDMAVDLGAACPASQKQTQQIEREWAATSSKMETQIVYGGPLKALDKNGKVGGYLVTFTNDDEPDLTNTYFQADTYYGPRDGDGADVLFQHGLSITKSIDPDYLFAPMKTRKDDLGIWAETVLNMADEYEAMVFDLVQQGKLGWSSGVPGHMVRISGNGKITRWPIAEGSFTPTPAEPKHRFAHRISPLRSLIEQGPIIII